VWGKGLSGLLSAPTHLLPTLPYARWARRVRPYAALGRPSGTLQRGDPLCQFRLTYPIVNLY
jgi:hypothetical protein